jgi:hypothetical protein
MQYILVSVMVDRLALQLGLTLGNDSSFLNAACEYVIESVLTSQSSLILATCLDRPVPGCSEFG